MSDTHIIVYSYKGKSITLTGWRLWLFLIAAHLLTAFFIVVLIFLLLGFAITLAMILLFAIPLALVFAVVSSLLRSLRQT